MNGKLISNYKRNDELKIEQIVIEYSNYVYKIVRNMTNSLLDEDIEEIVSDVFLAVWNNKEKLKEEMPLEPYIIGITKNIVKNKYRQVYSNDDIDKYESIIADSTDIQLIMEQKEKNRIIKRALDSMKKEEQNIFILYYYCSKSIREISNELKITEIKTKTKLHRIRKKIREFLEKGGYSYGQ